MRTGDFMTMKTKRTLAIGGGIGYTDTEMYQNGNKKGYFG